MTIWRVHIACWIPKVTNTHSEYVILIDFPLQQQLHKYASMLCYMYIAFVVITKCVILLHSSGTFMHLQCPQFHDAVHLDFFVLISISHQMVNCYQVACTLFWVHMPVKLMNTFNICEFIQYCLLPTTHVVNAHCLNLKILITMITLVAMIIRAAFASYCLLLVPCTLKLVSVTL
jgi:hypothetical protein